MGQGNYDGAPVMITYGNVDQGLMKMTQLKMLLASKVAD